MDKAGTVQILARLTPAIFRRETGFPRAVKVADMRTLIDQALGANRDLDDAERTRFDALEVETRSIVDQIISTEKLAGFEQLDAMGEPVSGAEMRRELRYSLSKATREGFAGAQTGLEAEMHAELSRGREVRGVMVPTEIILGSSENRALTTTTPVGNTGGNLVSTSFTSITDRRRPAIRVEGMAKRIGQAMNAALLTTAGRTTDAPCGIWPC